MAGGDERSDLFLRFRHVNAPERVDEAIDEALAMDCYSPYDRVWLMGPEKTANRIDENERFRWDIPINNGKGKHRKSRAANLCGGISFFRREVLEETGGWDERFRGWGSEDTAMEKTVNVRGYSIGYGKRKAYHMYHKKDRTGAKKSKQLYRSRYANLRQQRTETYSFPSPSIKKSESPEYPSISDFVAVTALSQHPHHLQRQSDCLDSWKAFGLHIVATNTEAEVAALRHLYPQVDEWEVSEELTDGYATNKTQKITSMTDVAVRRKVPILLLNSDIEIHGTQNQLLDAIRPGFVTAGIRHNYKNDWRRDARREAWGIDAFYMEPEFAASLPRLDLGIGKPVWDYWLPIHCAATKTPSLYIGHPLFYHKSHPTLWSQSDSKRAQSFVIKHYGETNVSHFRDWLPFGRIYAPGRMPGDEKRLIVASGMERSGSTWLYNAARVILRDSVAPGEFSCGWREDAVDEQSVHLAKSHRVHPVLDRADIILYSYRDIRDVLASLHRIWDEPPAMKTADRLVHECDSIEPRADYVMRYDEMLDDPLTVIEGIAKALGCEVNASKVLDELNSLDTNPETLDAVTNYHPGHITNGGRNAFASSVPASLAESISEKHADWLTRHDYKSDAVVSD